MCSSGLLHLWFCGIVGLCNFKKRETDRNGISRGSNSATTCLSLEDRHSVETLYPVLDISRRHVRLRIVAESPVRFFWEPTHGILSTHSETSCERAWRHSRSFFETPELNQMTSRTNRNTGFARSFLGARCTQGIDGAMAQLQNNGP